jgi:hypothetical protein
LGKVIYVGGVVPNEADAYTVIIFLARNGRIRAVKFRPKNFGRISFDLGEISPNQQILRLNNGRNSPKIFEGEPQMRGFARFARKNIYCVIVDAKLSTTNLGLILKCFVLKPYKTLENVCKLAYETSRVIIKIHLWTLRMTFLQKNLHVQEKTNQ